MSGHSKWHNIQARKGKQDAARGKLFTKLGRELNVAVKQGGPDPETNSTLAAVIAKAKANNMPNDTIANAIKKASGAGNAENYETIIYEGYAPNGVAIVVEAMTDNKNRTASDVRHVFDKHGGKLGTSGCVLYMFKKMGQIILENDGKISDLDELLEEVLTLGAEDLEYDDQIIEIKVSPEKFTEVLKGVQEKYSPTVLEAGIKKIADNNIVLDSSKYEKVQTLVDKLEDLDDVQSVDHNAEEE